MERVAAREQLAPELIRDEIRAVVDERRAARASA